MICIPMQTWTAFFILTRSSTLSTGISFVHAPAMAQTVRSVLHNWLNNFVCVLYVWQCHPWRLLLGLFERSKSKIGVQHVCNKFHAQFFAFKILQKQSKLHVLFISIYFHAAQVTASSKSAVLHFRFVSFILIIFVSFNNVCPLQFYTACGLLRTSTRHQQVREQEITWRPAICRTCSWPHTVCTQQHKR